MRNKKIDNLKFFSIISIICAHISPVDNAGILNNKLALLFDSIGCLGVGVFFAISGYFFYNNSDQIKTFINKKIKTIFVPWLCVGTVVFLAVYYFNNNLSLTNYLLFIFGYGSYLYYLFVLTILYFIYYKFKKNNMFLLFGSIISILSIIITIIIGYNKFSYVNIFNWLIYFNLGIIINKYDLYQKITKFSLKYFGLILMMLLIIFNIHLYFNYSIRYWSYFGPITIIINAVFWIGCIEKYNTNNKIINYIGKNSMAFYLIHMPVAGIIVRITNYLDNTILIALRLFFTLIITLLIIYMYDIIVKKINKNCLKNIVGIR